MAVLASVEKTAAKIISTSNSPLLFPYLLE
jgi:hypothetical protein